MAEESDLERTEPATSRRLEKAREEGDIPRSRELTTCMLLLAAGMGLLMTGEGLAGRLSQVLSGALHFDRSLAFDVTRLLDFQLEQLAQICLALAPLAGILMLVALLSPVLLGGWLFSAQAIAPNFERMNPLTGFGRIVSINALMELLKALGKSAIVGLVAYWVIRKHSGAIIGLVSEDSTDGLKHVADLLVMCFIFISSGLIVIMAIDVPFQLYNYAKKLKMTLEEVKQENKESNGNPQIKAKIRSQQREMARRRMMGKVPTADVVVTNPTHYAVALKYTEGRMNAPVVVAKGADLVAARIRELAKENLIPMMEAPPLARALFAHAELNEPIPEVLYTAVAEVLAYVFQLRAFKANGGLVPQLPETIFVPEELDPASAAALKVKQTRFISDENNDNKELAQEGAE